VGTRCANHVTALYPQKLALISPTGGGRSVGMVRSRTKATKFSLLYICIYIYIKVKINCSRYRCGVAQRVVRRTDLLFNDRGTRRGEWTVARPGRSLPLAKVHFTGGWMGPRACLDGRKISSQMGVDPGPTSP